MDYPYKYAALCLDGEQTVTCQSDIGFNIDGFSPFTIDAWVKTTEAVAQKSILTKKDEVDLRIDGHRLSFFMAGYPAVTSTDVKGVINPNEWTHVCVVYNLTNIMLYINGVINIFTSVGGQGTRSNEPFLFGDGLAGMLREVRIFKKALNSDQVVLYMMNSNLSDPEYKSLFAAYYDFKQVPAVEQIKNKIIPLPNQNMQQYVSVGALFHGNSYITIDREPKINPGGLGNDAYTIQTWVYFTPNEFEDSQTIFANGDVNDMAGMSLYIEKTENQYHVFSIRGSGSNADDILKSEGTVLPYQWINIAITYAVDTMKLYLNGSLDHSLSRLYPNPVTLPIPNLRIGSEVLENNLSGRNWFSGCISRLDVWNRELSPQEIQTYAREGPDIASDGLQASFAFHQESRYNSCSGTISGERNYIEFGEVCSQIPPNRTFLEQSSVEDRFEEPLTAEQLTAFREQAFTQEGLELTSQILAESGVAGAADLTGARFTVTSHVVEDLVYFVAHDSTSSYTICYTDAASMDPVTQWWIEMVLIIIGGVISILFGVRISASSKKLLDIIKSVIRNPGILTLFPMGVTISVNTIIELIKILFQSGVLIDLLRAALSNLSFWKVTFMIGKIVVLAGASFIGGWVYYLAALGVLAIEITIHITKYPKKHELPAVGLASIRFHHSLPGDATRLIGEDSSTRTMPVPEWTSTDPDNSHAAYTYNSLSEAVIVQASFQCSDKSSFDVKMRCRNISADKVFDDSSEITVSMEKGFSSPSYINFSFPSHKLKDAGVASYRTTLQWEQKDSTGTWVTVATTNHQIYVLLTNPTLPWDIGKARPPWVSVLQYACEWAKGAKTVDEVAEKLTYTVNQRLGLKYEDKEGKSQYYDSYNRFQLTKFLKQLRTGKVSSVVNCTDCAMICSTFANAVGCCLSQKRMQNTVTHNGFLCNPILPIGLGWQVPFGSGFGYHEVCMMEPLSSSRISPVAENNYLVYDACLHINGSAHPSSSSGRTAYLPVGIRFSNYGNGLSSVPNIPVNQSYREHLATNTGMGIGSCYYSDEINSNNSYIYKNVV